MLRNRRNGQSNVRDDTEVKENEIYEMNGSQTQEDSAPNPEKNTNIYTETKLEANDANQAVTETTYTFAEDSVASSDGVLKDNILYGTS